MNVNRIKYYLMLGLVVCAASVYLGMQVFPALHAGDSGELIAAANVLGNAHPPGYPLFSLFGKIALFGAPENPALRVNQLQVFYGVLAVFLVFILAGRSFKNSSSDLKNAAAVFAGLLLFSGSTFIEQATVAEVFMLNLVFALLIFISLAYGKYMAAGFFSGLAIGNQHTILLVFPMVFFMMISGDKNVCIKRFAGFMVCLLLGLTVYIYMPLRSAVDPVMNWGDPHNLKNFIRVFTRQDYGTLSLHADTTAFSVRKLCGLLAYFTVKVNETVTTAGLIVFFAGLWMLLKKNARFAFALIIFLIFTGPVFFIITNIDIDESGKAILGRFFLLPYTAVVIGACGIFHLRSRLKYAVFAIPVYLIISNFHPGSTKKTVLYNYIRDVADTVNTGEPVYISRGGVGDDIVFGLAYLKWACGKLQDSDVYSEYGSIFPAPVPVKGKAAFATFSDRDQDYKLYQCGLLYKNYRQDFDFNSYRSVEFSEDMGYRQRNIAVNYPFFRAKWLFGNGMIEEADDEISNALRIGHDIPWLMNNIGNLYRDAGNMEKAFEYYNKAVTLDPRMAESYNNLANLYFRKGQMGLAVQYYEKAIAIKPDPVRYYNLGLTYLNTENYI
ncbi:protein O-mannosyl-transferase family, partial [Elusimicrobiota bacterium]